MRLMINPGFARVALAAALAPVAAAPTLARDHGVAMKAIPLYATTRLADGTIAAKGKAIPVKFGVETPLAEYYEYNTGTCAEISPGSWALSGKKPRHGTIANTAGSYTATSGECAGDTYTTAVVNYTWTDSTTTKKRDKFTADWTTPDGEFNIPFTAKLKLVK